MASCNILLYHLPRVRMRLLTHRLLYLIDSGGRVDCYCHWRARGSAGDRCSRPFLRIWCHSELHSLCRPSHRLRQGTYGVMFSFLYSLLSKGYALVEYEKFNEAESAIKQVTAFQFPCLLPNVLILFVFLMISDIYMVSFAE